MSYKSTKTGTAMSNGVITTVSKRYPFRRTSGPYRGPMVKDGRMPFRMVEIRTGSKVRRVAVPSPRYAAYLRTKIPGLTELCRKVCDNDVVHGFMPGRSVVTNALRHVGPFEVTVSFDLKDFFESCSYHVHKKQYEVIDLAGFDSLMIAPTSAASYSGYPIQGLPTSPILANIIASPLDEAIKGFIPHGAVYTRYADDLSISLPSSDDVDSVVACVKETARISGFEINERKTTIQYAKSGRRIICGVGVDATGIYPTRRSKRRQRAAEHSGRAPQARGLAEWNSLKRPHPDSWRRKDGRVQRAWSKNVGIRILNEGNGDGF